MIEERIDEILSRIEESRVKDAKHVNMFIDTMNLIRNDGFCKKHVEEFSVSKNKYYDRESMNFDHPRRYYSTNVRVTPSDSFFEAERCKKDGGSVCVLNFASQWTPGGGVLSGWTAQEESLCQTSTLYLNLSCEEAYENFYIKNRKEKNSIGADKMIYSPDVVVFKDMHGGLMELPILVDVITCAAPDLRKTDISNDELRSVLHDRYSFILQAAYNNNVADVVLGAYGCGVFKNDPQLCAEVWNEVIDEYAGCFRNICFPMFSYNSKNFDIFFKEICLKNSANGNYE